ncbi:MAG: hypothetical protein U0167_00410 [bacterium]
MNPPGAPISAGARRRLPDNLPDAISAALLAVLACGLALEALLSLGWRMQHDAPLMLYLARMATDLHRVMYRDIVDVNMPGTYLVNAIVLHVFGTSDLAFRCADLLYLAAILAATARAAAPFGTRAACGTAAIAGTMYLSHGAIMSLQREVLVLLPLALALAAWSTEKLAPGTRWFLVGLFFGLAATVKPPAALGLPIAILWTAGPSRRWFARVVLGAAGFVVPIAAMAAFLAASGGLAGFVDMARNYWPLYAQIDAGNRVPEAGRRAHTLALCFRWSLWNLRLWLLPAAAGLANALLHRGLDARRRRLAALAGMLVVAYSLYAAVEGRFWEYHLIPFSYFLAFASALALVPRPRTEPGPVRALPAMALLAALVLGVVAPPDEIRLRLRGEPIPPPKGGKVDAIAAYLRDHLAPGDTVQPLDWSGGAVHAMLIARATIATSFIYDHYFYHHVSTSYIQGLRRRFIEELTRARPRFIVQITANKPWVTGRDTTKSFDELDRILRDDYRVAVAGNGFVIHERRGAAAVP